MALTSWSLRVARTSPVRALALALVSVALFACNEIPPQHRAAAVPSGNFSLVLLPDTQLYSRDFSSIFRDQTGWIVDNRKRLNIAFVTHLGDCVQNADREEEWQHADDAMSLLEDPATTGSPVGVPYGIAVGNHDQFPEGDSRADSTSLYNKYFGVSRFQGRSYYGGHLQTDNDNHVEFFSASGLDFMVIHLEYDSKVDRGPIEWAADLLEEHRERRAILVTHFVIDADDPGSFSRQGRAIYQALRGYPNLFLMLGGHSHGESRRTDVFDGTTVHTLMADYTDLGEGWLRILEFAPGDNKILVRTYSPTLDRFDRDAESEFALSNWMSRCTDDSTCDDGISCTANRCVSGECVRADRCVGGEACELETGQCVAPPLFTAYNDLAWETGQLSKNVTSITSPNGGSSQPSTGELVDFTTGAPTGVELTVSGGSYSGHVGGLGAVTVADTDAHRFFSGKVDTLGTVSPSDEMNSPLVLRFGGLRPEAHYEVVFHAHRNSWGQAHRGLRVELSGADGFDNRSSIAEDQVTNPLFSGPDDSVTRLPAVNRRGFVARFTDIKPGRDGEISLTVRWDGSGWWCGRISDGFLSHLEPRGFDCRGRYGSAVMVRATSETR